MIASLRSGAVGVAIVSIAYLSACTASERSGPRAARGGSGGGEQQAAGGNAVSATGGGNTVSATGGREAAGASAGAAAATDSGSGGRAERDAGAAPAECAQLDASTGAVRWPDSPTAICGAPCKSGEVGFGEDGSYELHVPKYTAATDTVTDSVSRLTWQRTVASATMSAVDAASYCDALSLGGASDFRLPSWTELASIVDYGASPPAVPSVFAIPKEKAFRVWSSGPAGAARVLSVYDGSFMSASRSDSVGAWCVRGEPLASRLVAVPGCASVRDSQTGLVWQRDAIGIPSFTGAWLSALSYCETLTLGGHDDWRLPSIKELATLVVDRSTPPLLDLSVFPASPTYLFLSSTPTVASRGEDTGPGVWRLNFSSGASDTSMDLFVVPDAPIARSAWPAGPYGTYARCVR